MRAWYFAAMNLELPLDHLALRVLDRDAAVASLAKFGYRVVDSFEIQLEDGSAAKSFALDHPFSPDVFVTSGPIGSFIWRWVQNRGRVGAVHHFAYAVDDVAEAMERFGKQGVKFQSKEPLICSCDEPLVQVFTRPDPTTGLIYELIERNGHPGFCAENVKRLMDGSPE
jgi:catechol 2,3-dioxygenase-like lactoylglutathione lyase family enzyme